jgi:Cysteine-rich secretory protein family
MLMVMLRDHNAARRDVGTPALVLDPDLVRQAQAYAEELAASGRFEHSPGNTRPGQGENLWAGTANRFSFESMAGAWIDERRFYVHAVFPNVSTTGNWQDVGHYTQIIWRNTTRLGCGLATGNGRDVLVCRYGPPGNFIGQFAY